MIRNTHNLAVETTTILIQSLLSGEYRTSESIALSVQDDTLGSTLGGYSTIAELVQWYSV